MRTEEEIAKIINYKGKVYRTITTYEKLNFQVGQIVDNLGMSWCDENGVFYVENEKDYTYLFRCDGVVKGHKVNYDNEKEVYILSVEGCEDESEILVLNSQKFRVLNVCRDYNFTETEYYQVTLEALS